MNEPAPGAAPEPAAETWTYGGIRADKDGKKWHAWVDAAVTAANNAYRAQHGQAARTGSAAA